MLSIEQADSIIKSTIKGLKQSNSYQKISAPYDEFFHALDKPRYDQFKIMQITFMSTYPHCMALFKTDNDYIKYVLRYGVNKERSFVKLLVLGWSNNCWVHPVLTERVNLLCFEGFKIIFKACVASLKNANKIIDNMFVGNLGHNRQLYHLDDDKEVSINNVRIEGCHKLDACVFEEPGFIYTALMNGFQRCDVIHNCLEDDVYSAKFTQDMLDQWLGTIKD